MVQLQVRCPSLVGGSLAELRQSIERAITASKRAADDDGHMAPLAILFGEQALCYRYNLSSGSVMAQLDVLQRLLPRDAWVACAFNVLENNNGLHSSAGYLLGPQGWQRETKRNSSFVCRSVQPGDWSSLKQPAEFLVSAPNPSNPTLSLPSGLKIEHRICADLFYPMVPQMDIITLVSAHGLQMPSKSISNRRLGIIVNDDLPNWHIPRPEELPTNYWASNRPRLHSEFLQKAGIVPVADQILALEKAHP